MPLERRLLGLELEVHRARVGGRGRKRRRRGDGLFQSIDQSERDRMLFLLLFLMPSLSLCLVDLSPASFLTHRSVRGRRRRSRRRPKPEGVRSRTGERKRNNAKKCVKFRRVCLVWFDFFYTSSSAGKLVFFCFCCKKAEEKEHLGIRGENALNSIGVEGEGREEKRKLSLSLSLKRRRRTTPPKELSPPRPSSSLLPAALLPWISSSTGPGSSGTSRRSLG